MAILPINWTTVDKHLGCWILRHSVVGFVFKFGSNGTNFDVSTPFLMGRGGAVSVRELKVSEMVSGPTSLSHTLVSTWLILSRAKYPLLPNRPTGGLEIQWLQFLFSLRISLLRCGYV